MRIFFAADHAGLSLKADLIAHILSLSHDVQDLGAYDDKASDYPIYAEKLAKQVLKNSGSIGILICGSGIGMSIAANRFKGIRAALCMNPDMAKLAREHNNANVLVLGSRLISTEESKLCVEAFLSSKFLEGHHTKRVSLIDSLF